MRSSSFVGLKEIELRLSQAILTNIIVLEHSFVIVRTVYLLHKLAAALHMCLPTVSVHILCLSETDTVGRHIWSAAAAALHCIVALPG